MAPIYHDPSALESSMPVYRARITFLTAVAEVVPDVLASLRDDVLPVYRTTWQDTEPTNLRQWSTLRTIAMTLRDLPEERRPHALALLGTSGNSPVPFVDSAAAWMARWNLTDDWCANHVLLTLRVWANAPETLAAPPGLSWHNSGMGTWVGILDIPTPEPWKWNIEDWEVFEERVETWKRRNRETAERAAAEVNYVLPKEKRAPRHYGWLALYQCAGMSPARIAQQYRLGTDAELARKRGIKAPGRKTVEDAVRDTAEQIGLTRRGGGG